MKTYTTAETPRQFIDSDLPYTHALIGRYDQEKRLSFADRIWLTDLEYFDHMANNALSKSGNRIGSKLRETYLTKETYAQAMREDRVREITNDPAPDSFFVLQWYTGDRPLALMKSKVDFQRYNTIYKDLELVPVIIRH
jgi:hypothetical protein